VVDNGNKTSSIRVDSLANKIAFAILLQG
jgi:hypothetical protein